MLKTTLKNSLELYKIHNKLSNHGEASVKFGKYEEWFYDGKLERYDLSKPVIIHPNYEIFVDEYNKISKIDFITDSYFHVEDGVFHNLKGPAVFTSKKDWEQINLFCKEFQYKLYVGKNSVFSDKIIIPETELYFIRGMNIDYDTWFFEHRISNLKSFR